MKIDSRPTIAWPKKKSVEITDLDAKAMHRAVVYCDSKPQQSFKFRLSDYPDGKACLFLNDLYWTAQLWDMKHSPWCRCAEASAGGSRGLQAPE